MADLRSFEKRMQEVSSQVEENSKRLVRRVAIAVHMAVVQDTPVKTGRARANWRANIGSPAEGIYYYPRPKPASPEGAAEEAISQGISEILGSTLDYGTAIHITNNLPYIRRLNDGYSKQAPAGFVERAVVEARIIIDKSDLISSVVTTERI